MTSRVLIIAGGTGGHIFPALAVADCLCTQGIEVHWLGSKIGLENTLVPERFPITYIDASRLRGKGLRAYLFAPWRLLRALAQAARAIRHIRPQAVLAMGGFVSGPGGLAARCLGVPLVVHEQNAIAGYSNRLLARFAKTVLTAYPGAFPGKKNSRVVGNPVRAEISALAPPQVRLAGRQDRLRLLVLGGSQGAHALNQLVATSITTLPERDHLTLWHQTGKHDDSAIQAAYDQAGVSARVQPFIENIQEAYEWADVLIGRAGALTVAEMTAAGLGGILVPFPAAVDDHQWYNARFLEEAGAAVVIREADLTPASLAERIQKFLADRPLLIQMAQKARELAKPNAAREVAEAILQLSPSPFQGEGGGGGSQKKGFLRKKS